MRIAVARVTTHQASAALTTPQHSGKPPRPRPSFRSILNLTYHWLLWGFFSLLIFGQVLGIVWSRVTAHVDLYFGQDPSLGLYQVLGTNDAPFTDRAFVCLLRGRVYKPMQLQQALDSPSAIVVDTSGTAVNGYRMVKRTGLSMSDVAMAGYANTCDTIAATMESVLDRCEQLGYNVTRDSLQIVEGATSLITKHILGALPVVVMPFSDSTLYSRYAIPGWDGNACLFRLNGAYETVGYPDMTFRAVNRTVREKKTVEMLGKYDGVWRNGWYEDPEGGRWYSEFFSTDSTPLSIATREFDMLSNAERNCTTSRLACGRMLRQNRWGARLTTNDDPLPYTSITILNADHFGIFLFKASVKRWVESVYEVNVLVANLSLGALLIRWMIAKIAMLNSYLSGKGELQSVGIAALSCAHGFHFLPLFLLPRLKTYLAVFATIGGAYEGPQSALAEAWFIMYPGIAEILLFCYSLLNLVTKLLHRRMSGWLFGPTLIFLCIMHYLRTYLAQSGWFEYDGRVVTVLSSKQFDQLSLLDFFRNNTLLKLNGNVKSLFFIKVGVLSLNLLPILFSKPISRSRDGEQPISATEAALGLHLASSGGLGPAISRKTSRFVSSKAESIPQRVPILSSFELLRLGYVVLEDAWLISIYDWYLLAMLTPFSKLGSVSMRVMLFAVKFDAAQGCYCIDEKPILCRISDPRISNCNPWQISTHSFR